MRGIILSVAIALLIIVGQPVGASIQLPPPGNTVVACDFVTGGGFIVGSGSPESSLAAGAKANFAVGGGVKNGAFWGHLEYVDHSYTPPLNVHWTSITAYRGPGCSPTGPSDANTRCICGTARSNVFGDVEFGVVVDDLGEPGVNDVFKIRLTQGGQPVYTTESDSDHTLGGSGSGGGNIQLHKPNPSTTPPPTFTECDRIAPNPGP